MVSYDVAPGRRGLMEADFVIVGSGSAGSALAYRLGEAGHSVLVARVRRHRLGAVHPDAGGALLSDEHAPLRLGLRHRARAAPRRPAARLPARQGAGRLVLDQRHGLRPRPSRATSTLGRAWAPTAGAGPTSLPYFTPHGDLARPAPSDWRGSDGPLHVTRGPRRNPLYHAFVEAGAEAGFERTHDYNGAKQEGFGPMEQTVWRGRRWSAANAYLRPALRGGKVRGGALPRRAGGDRARAAPSASRSPRGERREIGDGAAGGDPRRPRRSTRPKLLMLSGIGPAAHLAEHGIAGRRRPARRRRQPAGPPRALHPDAEPAGRSRSTATTTGRRGCAIGAQWLLAQVRARRLEPVRVRPPSSARPPGSSIPTSSTTSCRSPCATTARRRCAATASRRMSGRCARPRAATVRLTSADPAGGAGDPLQLHGRTPRTGATSAAASG